MTKALADILTEIRTRGNLTGVVRFPDSMLTQEAQAAFGQGYQLIEGTNPGYFDTDGTVSTVAGQAFVALTGLGTVVWKLKAVDVLVGTEYVAVPRAGLKDRNKYGAARGRPVQRRRTARGLDLFPTPDQIYSLRVTYTPAAPVLSATALEYYNGWEEYTVYGALIRLYKQMGRESAIWNDEFARAAEMAIDGAGDADTSGPEYLNLRDGSDDDFDNDDGWRRGY